jgi:hypothetical protein
MTDSAFFHGSSRFAGAFAALALVAAAPAAGQGGERFSLTGDVAIYNVAGEVTIESGSAGGVIVEMRRGGSDAGRLTVDTGELFGWQTLRVRFPSDRVVYPRLGRGSRTQFDVSSDGTFGQVSGKAGSDGLDLRGLLRIAGIGGGDRMTVTGSGSGLEAWADLRILVPAGRTVAVHLGVGQVRASNVDGRILIDARSASISGTNVGGTVRVNSGSGTIAFDDVRGDVSLDTGSGSVRVNGMDGSRLVIDTGSGSVEATALRAGELNIDTGSGSIRLDDLTSDRVNVETGSGRITITGAHAPDLSVDTGSGSVAVDLAGAVRIAHIETGSGGVTITVPENIGANIDFDSGSGGVSSDLPVRITEKKRSSLRGVIGDGSGRIHVETGSGSIRLRAR